MTDNGHGSVWQEEERKLQDKMKGQCESRRQGEELRSWKWC